MTSCNEVSGMVGLAVLILIDFASQGLDNFLKLFSLKTVTIEDEP